LSVLEIRPLHPLFVAEVIGLDLSRPLPQEVADQVRAAFQRYSVLVFRDQDITDDQQVAFSRLFGDLETTRAGAADAGGFLIRLSNMGPNGEIVPPSDKQVLNNKANQQ
jgi:alpha-ketoglutarate-dependent 2,4-dichlorophenoxyacetate dioxygenase